MRTSLINLLLALATSANAATYYLDVNATGTQTGTSWANAWTNFGSVLITGGDTLQIAAGTYYMTATMFPPSGTAPETPTLIQVAQDGTHSGPVIIDGGDTVDPLIRFSNRRWITIDGEYAGATNLTFQNWGGNGTATDSFALQGSGGSYCHTNILRYLKVINDQYMQEDDLRIPISITYAKGVLISHCWVEGGMRASINITAYGTPDAWDWNVVEYTTIRGFRNTDGRGGPDGVKGSATVRYCHIFHDEAAGAHVNPSHTAEDGIQWLSSWNRAYGNVIHDVSQSLIRTDVNTMMSNVWVFGNVLYSTHPDDGAIQRALEFDGDNYVNCRLFNNVVANIGAGFRFIKGAATTCDIHLLNNVVFNSSVTMSESGGDHDEFVADYNLLLTYDGEQASFTGALAGYTQAHNPFNAGAGFAFAGQPSYVDVENWAADIGTRMNVNTGTNLAYLYTAAGVAATDQLGTARGYGGGWDVGAIEFTADAGGDTTAPIITGISASPSTTSATVQWSTDEDSTSGLEFGPTTAYGSSSTNSAAVTSHSLSASGLTASTLYHYRVHSTDAAGNHAQSSDGTFTTDAAGEPVAQGHVSGGRIGGGRFR